MPTMTTASPLSEYRTTVYGALDALRGLQEARSRAVEAIHAVGDSNEIPQDHSLAFRLFLPIVNELEFLALVVSEDETASPFEFQYVAESEEALRVLVDAAFGRLERAEADKGADDA